MEENTFSTIVVATGEKLLTSKEGKLMDKHFVFRFQPTS